jgi:UDP-2,3-diacylglucosamine hydrolase
VDYSLNDRTRLILLGDWVTHFSYAVFDGQELKLETFVNP